MAQSTRATEMARLLMSCLRKGTKRPQWPLAERASLLAGAPLLTIVVAYERALAARERVELLGPAGASCL